MDDCEININFIHKIAVIITGFINIILFVYVFFYNKKTTNNNREKDRRYNLFKSLILDNTMKVFYKFFEDIEEELKPLKNKKSNIQTKKSIKSKIDSIFAKFRKEFIVNFIAIDHELYTKQLMVLDNILDQITYFVFDATINLEQKDKFEQTIGNSITTGRVEILKVIFSYNSKS